MRWIILILLLCFSVVAFTPRMSYVAVGLHNISSGKVYDGNYTVKSSIYYASAGDSRILEITNTTAIVNGTFGISFGGVSIVNFSKDLWIEVNVSGDQIIPRLEITPSPQSMYANQSRSCDYWQGIDQGTMTNAKWCKYTSAAGVSCDVDPVTDTTAATLCSGTTTYLDGEGNCDDISSAYIAVGTKLGNSTAEIRAAEIDADHDECSEISGCVVGAITDGNTNWDNIYDLVAAGDANSTTSYCGNITGAASDLCALVDTDTDDQTCAEVSGCVENAITQANSTQEIRKAVNDSAIGYYFHFLRLDDWSNVTITTSQITDFSAFTDTYNSSQEMRDAVNISGARYDFDAASIEGVDWGTMTNAKWCVYDSGSTEVDCNVDPVVDTDDQTCAEVSGCVENAITQANSSTQMFNACNNTALDLSNAYDYTETDAAHNECSEISGCVVGAITDGNTNWNNLYDLVAAGDANSTTSYCGNITGAASDLCTLIDTDTTYTNASWRLASIPAGANVNASPYNISAAGMSLGTNQKFCFGNNGDFCIYWNGTAGIIE